MKKILSTICICILTLQMTSCKTEAKKEDQKETKTVKEEEKSSAAFSLKTAKNDINFTAYKTTEKVPVKGVFTKIEVLKGGEGNSVKEAMNGVEFKIPVSGIETKDNSRNYKIQKFFFGVMENTINLTGKLSLNDDTKGSAEFTMNGVTEKLPFEYTIEGNIFTMKTVMDIEKWNARNAVESLNVACKELHKGADGVSKTWSEVTINVVSTF